MNDGRCEQCGAPLEIGDWPFCRKPSDPKYGTDHGRTLRTRHSIDPSQRAVVWENPATGEVNYPGRNDEPIPKRLRDRGFERKELSSLREIQKFEKRHNVINYEANYDKGKGRSPVPEPAGLSKEAQALLRSGEIKIRSVRR